MNNKKGVVGATLAIIMIASIFTAVVPSVTGYYDGTGNEVTTENKTVNTLRIYGEDGIGPNSVYSWHTEPFDPAVIPKDSITFDPAYLRGTDWSGQSHDIDVKKYLRIWYEPCHVYEGLDPAYTLQEEKYSSILVESTYMLIDNKHKLPFRGSANDTWFPFPIAETDNQTGLSAWGNGAALEENATAANATKLVYVAGDTAPYNKTLNGTIRLEKKYFLALGEAVQFLDHKLRYDSLDMTGNTAYCHLWYAGNKDDDAAETIDLSKGQKVFFDRLNNMLASPSHPDATWYARFESEGLSDEAVIVVGKELSGGDTFYVDGVRYDVPSIGVMDISGDSEADAFMFITLRTPLPKAPTKPEKVVRECRAKCIISSW
jgi:hypothetical protein